MGFWRCPLYIRPVPKSFSTEVVPVVEWKVDADEKGYVYVHVTSPRSQGNLMLRIWPTTYLVDAHSAHESKLVHAENIARAPEWTLAPAGSAHPFLLIFEGLPKHCTLFHLIERIPQPGGFEVNSIVRNQTDVYHVTLDE